MEPHQPHNTRKRIIGIATGAIAVASVSLNCLFVAPYLDNYWEKDNTPCFQANSDDSEVIGAVLKTSMAQSKPKMDISEFRGLPHDIKSLFSTPRLSEIQNNYYSAYRLAGISQYALVFHDEDTVAYTIKAANKFTDTYGMVRYKLDQVDQAPIGILFLNAYKLSGDTRFLKAAQHIFVFLKGKRANGNYIPYRSPYIFYTDALGMYVPFLMEYHAVTGDAEAYAIAKANVEIFNEGGIDRDTALPCHGFLMKEKHKVGSANWGRGIGWYLLAVAYFPEMNTPLLAASVEKLSYTQFPGSSPFFDSSTALMFELYKQCTQKERKLTLDFIKPYVRQNGHVTNCSGDTYGLNDYSHSFGDSELCNGLLLLLWSKYNEGKEVAPSMGQSTGP